MTTQYKMKNTSDYYKVNIPYSPLINNTFCTAHVTLLTRQILTKYLKNLKMPQTTVFVSKCMI